MNHVRAHLAYRTLDLTLEIAHEEPFAEKRYRVELPLWRAPVIDAVDRFAHQLAIGMLARADDLWLQAKAALQVHDVSAANTVTAQQRQRVVKDV